MTKEIELIIKMSTKKASKRKLKKERKKPVSYLPSGLRKKFSEKMDLK